MVYRFRIYHLTKDMVIIKKFKEKFGASLSVNYESYITTDEEGKELLFESERRGFIRIRGIEKL